MTISMDKILDGFPHPIIAPIVGIPTYESIAKLNLQLTQMQPPCNPTLVMVN